MQRATWGVDPGGVFVVNAELDKTRYDPSQTHIKWEAKERWQNDVRRLLAPDDAPLGTRSL